MFSRFLLCSRTPREYLQQQVYEIYGLEIDLSTVYIYFEMDPFLTPESLYLYVTSQ